MGTSFMSTCIAMDDRAMPSAFAITPSRPSTSMYAGG